MIFGTANPGERAGRMRRPKFGRGASVLTAGAVAMLLLTGCVAADANDAEVPVWDGTTLVSVPGLPDEALEVMNQPQFASGRWSISVEDLDTGETLIDLDGGKLAEPGSFVKTYSAGAAWVKWGPDHTVTTPVKQSGEVSAGTLDGDLVLVGQGDLTMGGRTKDDGTVSFANLDHNDANPLPGATLTPEDPLTGLDELAGQVKASGITTVNGDVIIDDRLFEGTLAEQPITPIVINQNLLDVLVTPGEAGQPATAALTPAVGKWTLDLQVETVPAGEESKVSAPKVSASDPNTLVVSGTIAADADPVLRVFEFDDPSTFARTAFIEALERAGVTVSADPFAENPTSALPEWDAVEALPAVAELESLPLAEEITYVMKVSYNRGAQTLICRLAVDAGKNDCDEDGMGVAQAIWAEAGLDTTGASLVDGSGLEGNYITPKNAVQIQSLMAERPDAERWRDTMPILGVDGSLADVQKDSPAAGKVYAKTGTLVGGDAFNDRLRLATKTLGGVMQTESGRNLAFTIIVNQGFYEGMPGVFEANDNVGQVAAIIQQAY
ncbi:D-alanyl-D-alanine carboxypeptidase/D-alanyl-D-alanine-endopeptidase (penicillin-binding protein 4) [Pseudoclavibacter sp. JAI123]|uniref:D-alanyl-D-alanine carboxypeptidase/D-alanyl-D-alanine endopeptidase n=1 Tax=Pseudoclavibacter sp. JAI123 TaxID=2723065 RepID=UPI00185DDCE8|nr:D-alanyl-D-alanine carboxypeptidase/D-alanyl-D-alanine-endopeptidase [Pseudoclavibacter sp. JAI123]NYF14070.1 D-alanyl-D-alanine carboxypeptidase/D-alanyl-D-alanine-endopeptidase (penicillin-binding protein 4) [Pseudoclavibacter sp. JAI123]